MRFWLLGVEIRVSFWFFAILCCFAVSDKETLFFYFALPMVVHELGHLVVMAALGVRVRRVSLTAFGVDIRRNDTALSYGGEIAVTLGGPLANGLLALFLYLCLFQSMRVMLLISVNLAVAMFNLAPIGKLDGGQIIRLLCGRFLPVSAASYVIGIANGIALTCLLALAVLLVLCHQFNPTLLLACGCLVAGLLSQCRR